MPDRLTEILSVHLVTEDVSLHALRNEILDLCSPAGGVERAIKRLEKCVEADAAHFILDKVPWYHIYLAFARYKQLNLPLSLHWASRAVDGFDQIDHVWNRAITRWFCALLNLKIGEREEASFYFEEASKLMRREIADLKRRSFYEKAGKCEKALVLLLADAAGDAPSARIGSQSVDTDSLGEPDDRGNFRTPLADLSEEQLYQNLLTKVGRDLQVAERLIQRESLNHQGLTRKDYIIRAIVAWEHDNR